MTQSTMAEVEAWYSAGQPGYSTATGFTHLTLVTVVGVVVVVVVVVVAEDSQYIPCQHAREVNCLGSRPVSPHVVHPSIYSSEC